jgi:hypothetical protein
MAGLWQERFARDRELVDVGRNRVPDRLPAGADCYVQVQFVQPLGDDDHRKLGALIATHPHAYLRAYGHDVESLDFLRHYPRLAGFHADLYELKDFSGLAHLPAGCRYVGLGTTKAKTLDLAVLARVEALEDLQLEGQAKGLAALLAARPGIKRLALRSITLPDLSTLLPLRALECFELRLGGTKDLALLPRIGSIRYLEIWQVKGLSDLSFLGALRDLQYLFLQSLKNVAALPNLAALKALRRIDLETMSGLADFASVARAPALEVLYLIAMNHLKDVAVLRPFVGHPTLKCARLGLGSLRRNAAAAALLGNLPDLAPPFAFAP